MIIDMDIIDQIEGGTDITKLIVKEPEYNSTILLKDGTMLNVKYKVKEIIEEIKKHA